MYDARLVKAAQEGDEAAFAAIFDRTADSVYDLCWSLTGDAHEAARLVEDTFVLAARHLSEVSEPSQLRPWLLAIARDRAMTEDEEGTLHSGWGTAAASAGSAGTVNSAEPLGTVALRRWTAEAAAVLALSDQAVLELQLRHGIDGEQLAAAIGCTPAQLPAIVGRVDEEAEHVLGALVLGRQGRRDCPELAAALEGWDGAPSAEMADVIDVHARGCERCSRRRALGGPLELLAAAPFVVAPPGLRTSTLDLVAGELAQHATRAGLAAAPSGGAETVAVPPVAAVPVSVIAAAPLTTVTSTVAVVPPPERGVPLTPIIAVAAAIIVLAGALFLALRSPSHPQSAAAIHPAVTSTLAPGTTVPDLGVPTVPATLAPIDTTSTTGPPPGGRLELNASRVDFGADATSALVVLRNTGLGAADWGTSTGVAWLHASPTSGHFDPGGAVSITFTLDRRIAPVGPFDVQLRFVPGDPNGASTSLAVVGTIRTPATTTTPSSSTTSTSTTSTTTSTSSTSSTTSTVPPGPTIPK